MKKILFSLLVYLLFPTSTFAGWYYGVGNDANSYYVADRVECSHTQFTCEYGYEAFFDVRGCGCKKIAWYTEPKKYPYYSGGNYINNGTTYNSRGNFNNSNSYYAWYDNSNTVFHDDLNYYSHNNNFYTHTNYNSSNYSNGYCNSNGGEVCAVRRGDCSGLYCDFMQPRTYANICLLRAVNAQYLYDGKCETQTRSSYNKYSKVYHGDSYNRNAEDYVMYLVDDFIYKIENNNYSGSSKLTAINRVIEKLDDLGDDNRAYRNAVNDAISELNKYKKRYQRGEAYDRIESIFDRY